MIAGLEDITQGTLEIGGKVMNDISPKDRDIAMVFQNYALYPHMTVAGNMAFGLKLRKYKKDDIAKRVDQAAEILGLTEFLDRKPADLSGGQRQRVALGRAIVRDAPIFLMDEPLSNLDAKLRVSMRAEIAKLHQRLSTTTIYVTHDQTEAMTMADRVVVMSVGEIQQIGTPSEIYDRPRNMFVAGFIGSPAMNFFNVHYQDQVIDDHKGVQLTIPEGMAKVLDKRGYNGKDIVFGIRPEDIHTEEIFIDTWPNSTVEATINVSELLGATSQLYSQVGNTEFVANVDSRDFHQPGAKVQMGFDINKAHFFDKETQNSIMLDEEEETGKSH
jgi:multiple sugar transport system ATP-binding protein